LTKSLSKEKYRTVLENLRYLETKKVKSAKTLKRRFPAFTKDEFNDFKRRSLNNKAVRKVPSICQLVEKVS